MQKISVGRLVRYVMTEGKHEERPAVIVNTWGHEYDESGDIQLQVFIDGSNDVGKDVSLLTAGQLVGGTIWKTSVQYSETKQPGTWHWPTRE